MASGSVILLQVNDVLGYLEPHAEPLSQGGRMTFHCLGGYARIATLLRRLRVERSCAVVALDNGDTCHGTYPVVSGKGRALEGLAAGLTLVDGPRAVTAETRLAAPPPGGAEGFATEDGTARLLAMLAMALLGGRILNLMPCVLPAPSLKLFSVARHGGAAPRAIRLGFLA